MVIGVNGFMVQNQRQLPNAGLIHGFNAEDNFRPVPLAQSGFVQFVNADPQIAFIAGIGRGAAPAQDGTFRLVAAKRFPGRVQPFKPPGVVPDRL